MLGNDYIQLKEVSAPPATPTAPAPSTWTAPAPTTSSVPTTPTYPVAMESSSADIADVAVGSIKRPKWKRTETETVAVQIKKTLLEISENRLKRDLALDAKKEERAAKKEARAEEKVAREIKKAELNQAVKEAKLQLILTLQRKNE